MHDFLADWDDFLLLGAVYKLALLLLLLLLLLLTQPSILSR